MEDYMHVLAQTIVNEPLDVSNATLILRIHTPKMIMILDY